MIEVVGALLIFVGITIFTSGFSRGKNATGAVIRNLLCLACGLLGYWFLGSGFAYSSGIGFIGYFDFFSQGTYTDVLTLCKGAILCGCVGTIYASSMHERCRIAPLVVFSLISSILLYPIVIHWGINGFLAEQGFRSSVLVVTFLYASVIALVGSSILGARKDKYTEDGLVRAIVAENPVFGSVGGILIIVGISTMLEASQIINGLLALACAILICTFISAERYRSVDLSIVLNATIAGFLAGTCVEFSYISIIVGLLVGCLMVPAVEILEKDLKVDDATGLAITFLIGTVVGLVFTSKQLLTQLFGVGSIILFTFAVSFILWKEIKHFVGLRVTEREEIEGIDTYARGINHAYLKYMPVVKDGVVGKAEYTRTKDILPDEDIVLNSSSSTTASPITKVEIITRRSAFDKLKKALDSIGVSGMTVTEVMGCGVQKGAAEYYRGVPLESVLLEKIRIEIVISKVPVELVVNTARKALYTGHIGDGKIFIYDVRDALKVRTGETGYNALQAVEDVEDVG
jgi:ammonium transporter, Amt family